MTDALRPGDEIGRYRVLSTLGEGGMGAVYSAERTDLPLRVALKTMHPSLRAREDAVKRFLREAEALARMRHPHVVDVVDFGLDAAHGPWLAMRLLDGESLAKRIERGAMSVDDALAWALPVAAGLRHAHAVGVVHRDLKPDNVFLARTSDGHDLPVVIDFGAARYDDGAAPLTASGVMLGTPFYMAPEQFWGARRATALSDQYALAFTLYECLAGATPFEAESLVEVIQRVQAGGFEALASRVTTVPAALSDAVMRALSVDPAQRFDDLAAFARALLPYAATADRARWSSAFGSADEAPPPAPPVIVPSPPIEAPLQSASTPVATPTSDAPAEALGMKATLDATDAPPPTATTTESAPVDSPAPSLRARLLWALPVVLAALTWCVWPRREPRDATLASPTPSRIEAPIATAPPVASAAILDASIATDAARPHVTARRPRVTGSAAHVSPPAAEPAAPTAPAVTRSDPPSGPLGVNGAPIRY